MSLDPVKNFFEAVITSTILSSSTTFTVGTGVGASFIDPAVDGEYNLIVFNSTDYPTPDADPYAVFLRVKSISTDTITIQQPASGNDYNGEGDSNIARDLNIAGKTYTVQRVASKNDWDKIQTELNGKEATIGYTTENAANKKTTITESDADYPTAKAVHTALAGKEATIGYTTENSANKKTSLTDNSDTYYPTQKAVKTAVDAKQDALGFTAENAANKVTSFQATPDDTHYASEKLVKDGLDAKQNTMTKAAGTDIDTGTDDSKYATSKAIKDSTIYGKKTTSETSSATPTPTGNYAQNEYYLTALAAGATFAAPSGTPVNGNNLIIRIKDAGAAKTLGFNAIFRAIGVDLPTTTVISKTIYLGCKYNSADSKWDVLAVGQEAA